MSDHTEDPIKLFTVEEANAMLPLIRAIAGDMVALSRDVDERRERLNRINDHHESGSSDPYADEVAQIEQELEKDIERLNEFARELSQLGVEPKGATEGLVDFPSRIDGRMVYLCWRYDEPEVLYWHELDGGFAGRQPLTVGSIPNGHEEDANGLQDS
ncbi:MAG: DUF2203 domain-containing protein [Pirellulaceae bacterium]|nr:DUF2203 domain-containing protein [Pirellulaceae bacterium]